MCQKRIDKYLDDRQSSSKKLSSEILEQLLDPNAARGHIVPNANDLNEEALTLLTAGNDTTSHAMILGAYFICSHPQVHMRLVEELQNTFPDIGGSITHDKAKEMPYLVCATLSIWDRNIFEGQLPYCVV